jgi:hypothetical protein
LSLVLQKERAQKVGLILAKRGIIVVPTMKVAAVMDVSPSIEHEIRNGHCQNALDQIAGAGLRFDDDGSIDVYRLYEGADYVGSCTVDDVGSYMRTEGMSVMSGTAYSPSINLVTESFFVRPARAVGKRSSVAGQPKHTLASRITFGTPKPSALETEVGNMPVFCFIVTDGEPQNEGRDVETQFRNIAPAIERASDYPIYLQFLGVSDNSSEQFRVLTRLAQEFPNVGFTRMSGFNRTDDEFYEAVITQKFGDWLKANVPQSATA